MFDDNGMTVMDSEGNPVLVPAWQYQQQEQRRRELKREEEIANQAQQPNQYEMGMAFAEKLLEVAGNKGDPEMMVKIQELSSQTQLQELKGGFDAKLGVLQADIDKTAAIEQVEARYNNVLANMQKQQEQLVRELEDQRRERIRSIEDAQVRMQSDINTTLTDAAKEGLGEFRETRRDMKELAKESMRSQQIAGQQGPYPPGTGPGYSPVQELTAEQLEAEFSGRAQIPEGEYQFEGGLDEAVTIPEDGDQDRYF